MTTRYLIKTLLALALMHRTSARPFRSAHRTYSGPTATPAPTATDESYDYMSVEWTTPITSVPVVSSTTLPTQSSVVSPIDRSYSNQQRQMQFGGVNIAGFDFGCAIDGTCVQGGAMTSLASGVGLVQMQHFVSKGLNMFRLPVGWQYLAGYSSPSTLDEGNFAVYNQLVQGCLNSGADMCIVDIHNYARWNGQIIGQGGPSNAEFARFWGALAGKYAGNSRVAFDLMNEPHDLDMAAWGDTMQAVVNSIRASGASNMVILSGASFASAGAFATSGGGQSLLSIKNPDGSNGNLIFSVHQYLDNDFSGTSTECTQGSNASSNLEMLAQFLRINGNRKAMLLETGGGNTNSCVSQVCQVLDTINANKDVFLGATTWAAGSFGSHYELNEVPVGSGSGMQDTPLVQSCVIPKLGASSLVGV